MHYLGLVIIPKKVYEQGQECIDQYLTLNLIDYQEDLEVATRIEVNHEELSEIYRKHNDGSSLETFIVEYYGSSYELDQEGNLTCKYNPNELFDYYVVGGRWAGLFEDLHLVEEDNDQLEEDSIDIKTLLNNMDKKIFLLVIDKQVKVFKEEEHKNWSEIYQRILEESVDDYGIIVDFHI